MNEKKSRLFKVLGFFLAVAAAAALVLLLSPPCLILRRTGYYCPACGTQRLVYALLAGDVPGAFRHNPFMFFLLPLLAFWLGAEAVLWLRGKRPLSRRKFFWPVFSAILLLMAAFTVLRNLPGIAFLGP